MAKAQGLAGQGAKDLGGVGLVDPRGWGPEMGPIARHDPGLSIELLLFSGPGLGHAVLTWSRPWNGTRDRNASTASTTAATRARAWNGSEGTGELRY
jgi:hypothetical protein